MDGLEAVEMKLSEVLKFNEVFRYDAEYFNKYAIELLRKIRDSSHIILKNEFEVSKLAGFEFTNYFTERNMISADNYIALTSKNIQNETLVLTDVITIDRTVANNNLKRSKLFKGDIVLSYTGEYRRSLVLHEGNYQLGPNVCRIRKISSKINPFFLSTFFNSSIGQTILNKEKTLSAQPTVSMSRIRLIPVPITSNKFQDKIEKIISKSYLLNEESSSFYIKAETLFLDELGLHKWHPTQANTEVKNFNNSFLQSGRLDAEYYQPKYDEVEFAIKNKQNILKASQKSEPLMSEVFNQNILKTEI